MPELVQLAVLLRILAELMGLAERAVAAGQTGVSQADIDAAFARADSADAEWKQALNPKPQEPPRA
jgi:hypothetical protein